MVTLMSFGFKYGEPADSQLMFDVRDLPNPFYVRELKEHTGLEDCVRDYVMKFPESRERFCQLEAEIFNHLKDRDVSIMVAIGCTGGHHRSVTMVEELKRVLEDSGYPVSVCHRDIQKGI